MRSTECRSSCYCHSVARSRPVSVLSVLRMSFLLLGLREEAFL